MSLVTKSCFRRALGPVVPVLLLLVLAVPGARAEEVTHQFSGQLSTITDGSGGYLDLRGSFSLGQAVTFQYTIERTATGVPMDAYVTGYQDALKDFAFTIGTWSGAGVPTYSMTTVTNNAPNPGNPSITYDQFSGQVQGGVTAPPLGTTEFQSLTYTLDDVQGTVFGSQAIPGTFPDLGAFEGKTFTVLFFDFTQFKSGYVMATLAGVTTPAEAATWGGLKALYR